MQLNDNVSIITDFGAIAFDTLTTHSQQALRIVLLDHYSHLTHEAPLSKAHSDLAKVYSQHIQKYLNNPFSRFHMPMIAHGTVFQQRVWQAIFDIPCGQTKTYGALARQLHSGPRAVANACGANILPILIPCHRVVAQNGLGGFMQGQAHGQRIKQWLLNHERLSQHG